MKPQLGDTILNRYTLVSSLREEPGIEAWKANDRVLAKDCQLFIVSDNRTNATVNDIAGRLAATRPKRHVPVLKYRLQAGVMIIITPLDSGVSLSEYLNGPGNALSMNAIRSIIGEVVDAIVPLQAGIPTDIVITTDTVRVTSSGVEIADASLSPLLADTAGADVHKDGVERHAVRQLSALLYALLLRQPSSVTPDFALDRLSQDTPSEFRVICKRGLSLQTSEEHIQPMASLAELDALLGERSPLAELGDEDIALPNTNGSCSIAHVALAPIQAGEITPIPRSLVTNEQLPNLAINAMAAKAGALTPAPLIDGASATAEPDGRRLFDFNLSQAWEAENLSGDDTNDWYGPLGSSTQALPKGNSRLTVPVPTGAVSEPTAAETTSRIPIFDASGRQIAPGEESQRALEEEQARIAEVSALPPSFIPKDRPSNTEDDELPDEHLFGNLSTKVVAIVVAVLVVAAAAVWAVAAFSNSGTNPADKSTTSDSSGDWPDVNMEEVPFGDTSSNDSQSDSSADKATTNGDSQSSDAKTTDDSSKSKTKSKTETETKTPKKTGDKNSSAVPQPRHENNTPFTIASANFLSNPGGQSGYGYSIHLDQPQDVYRMTITIRTSGGKGYIRANTTGDPTQGDQVAEFTFAEGGTTEVKFNGVINTQDLMLWVPMDSLPQNQLYIGKVEVF